MKELKELNTAIRIMLFDVGDISSNSTNLVSQLYTTCLNVRMLVTNTPGTGPPSEVCKQP
jgi:hypothetical protein